jgi:hypothetical protein
MRMFLSPDIDVIIIYIKQVLSVDYHRRIDTSQADLLTHNTRSFKSAFLFMFVHFFRQRSTERSVLIKNAHKESTASGNAGGNSSAGVALEQSTGRRRESLIIAYLADHCTGLLDLVFVAFTRRQHRL